jgi:glycine C-acetyltransferase
MAFSKEREVLQEELAGIREAGLYKEERYIHSPQGVDVEVEFPEGQRPREVINLCANNYLGLSSHPEVIKAAHEGLDQRGFGMSSVRFICGTQDIHRELENRLSAFLGTEDTILFSSCMDANAGVFEAFLTDQDAMIADKLVHASLIDGMRLCKAQQYVYKHSNMEHLEEKLQEAQDARFRLIVTDGVFSMDGDIAKLDKMVTLADKYNAMLLVDDSHATGFLGKTGRGTHELKGVFGKIDLITTTLGKAMGGASGGCVSGRKEVVDMLRQRARPYLFSNTLAPVIVSTSLKVLDLISETTELRDKLEENTEYFRKEMEAAGFDLKAGESPIIPVMLYNAKLAQDMSRDLYAEGIFAVGFFFPVVAKGQARIRCQISAAHEKEHLDQAINAFKKVGEKYGVLGLSKKEIIARFGM